MTTICPKCRTVRPADTSVPAWQCPACGVAYAKAGGAAEPVRPSARPPVRASSSTYTSPGPGIPWAKLIAVAALAWGGWQGYQLSTKGQAGSSESGLVTLAASAAPSDVLFYSAPWCANCAEAKGWMRRYGFKYQECDIDARPECAQQLRGMGGDGVPYLVVKGHHMKDGFDSDEFIAALQK